MKTDISLDLYKIFCTVVRMGNMSGAAKELYISQPAVSMAMRQLEEKLGKPLLIRSSKGIRTTEEGKILYEYLKQALGLIETAEKKYMQMVNLQIGEIKIGASDTVIRNYLIPHITKHTEEHPEINIKFVNRTTFETIKLLKSGNIDIGFVNLPVEPEHNLEVTEIMKVHECVIGGSKFKHLAEKGVTLTELTNLPLMLLENDSNSRKCLDDAIQPHGIIFKPNLELGSSELLVDFAKINLGVAIVTKEIAEKDIDNETLFEIPLKEKLPPRGIGLVRFKGVILSQAAQSFVNLFDL